MTEESRPSLQHPTLDLPLHPLDELRPINHLLLLPGPALPNRHRTRLRLAFPDDRHVRHLMHLSVADAVGERFPVGQHGSYARGFELTHEVRSRVLEVLRDGKHAHLLRSEPERERPRVVLDEPTDEPLHRSHQHAVKHHGAMALVVLAHVLQLEATRQVEVELNRRSLPLPPDCVDELEVEFGTVEGSPTLVVLERYTP